MATDSFQDPIAALYAALVGANVINDCGPFDGLGDFMRDALTETAGTLRAGGYAIVPVVETKGYHR
jgi:hypothetical protein